MKVGEKQGYILRVSHDNWVEQIFKIKNTNRESSGNGRWAPILRARDKRKEMFLHGAMLSEDTMNTILEITENYTSQPKP